MVLTLTKELAQSEPPAEHNIVLTLELTHSEPPTEHNTMQQ